MKEKIVRLKVSNLNKLFDQFKGNKLVIRSYMPESGWIKVEIEDVNVCYDFILPESRWKCTAPPVINGKSLPDTIIVLKETVKVINQLKYIGFPVSLITFVIGEMGIPIMSEYKGIERRIDFKKPTPVQGKNS